jgi:hypothetical protein
MECVVCENQNCLSISCGHQICKSCYIKSGKTTCPCCRKEIHEEIDEETRDLANFVIQMNKDKAEADEEFDIREDELIEQIQMLGEENLFLKTVIRKMKRGLYQRPKVK